MRATNKYYVDSNGDMIGYTRYRAAEKHEMPAEQFRARLKIVRIGWLNSGFCLELQDENGKTYNMNDVMFREYIKNKDVFLDGDWNFYQQGTSFSIGL